MKEGAKVERKVERNAHLQRISSASMFAMRVENLTIVPDRFQFHAELTMSQIMVETFARSLIDKIMLEAFGEIDTNDGKRLCAI